MTTLLNHERLICLIGSCGFILATLTRDSPCAIQCPSHIRTLTWY